MESGAATIRHFITDTSERLHGLYHRYLEPLRLPRSSDASIDRLLLTEPFGVGSVMRMKLRPGMEVILVDCRLNAPRALQFITDTPMIELGFWLDGQCEIDAGREQWQLRENACQVVFLNRARAEIGYRHEKPILFCEIRLAPFVFEQFIQELGCDGRLSWGRIVGKQPHRVFLERMDVNGSRLVKQMLACPYEAPFRKMYIEGKVLELLSMYFQHCLLDQRTASSSAALRRSDIDKIRRAAQLLSDRMDHPPSLLELSKLAEINDFKLKVGFKALYGTTVFGYLRDCRLERARSLLEKGQMTVTEAALAVGYSNPSFFASVFREKFGCNPGAWSRARKP